MRSGDLITRTRGSNRKLNVLDNNSRQNAMVIDFICLVAGTVWRSEVGEGMAGHYRISWEAVQRTSKATRVRIRVHPQ